jgi:outer membrane protein
VRAKEIAFEGVEQEAFVGLRTTLDVLDAEQELLNSRLDLVSAERDLYVASFALLQAMGRLDAQTLALPVEAYDPAEDLNRARWSPVDLTPWN